MKSCFISAGETSGDMHAATVIAELKRRYPDANFTGIAGEQMQAEGCQALHHMHALNVMGITDVLRSLYRIHHIERSILHWCATEKPDVAILVDFSSFHMRLGRKLKALGIPVVHFIAPKLWAWGGWRVKKLKKSQDRLPCILPFEPEWFQQHGISHARYVGNPSTVACLGGWSGTELKQQIGITDEQPLLALLPGSRPQEIRLHVPILVETLQRIQQQIPQMGCVVPVAPGVAMESLAALWKLGAKPLRRSHPGYALRADAAVAVSGTATLELALWDTPTVLIYKASPVMIFLVRRLAQIHCAGLANIILGDRPVMPELLQEACTTNNIVAQLLPLLRGETAAQNQRSECAKLRTLLGSEQPATGVAEMVDELIRT